MCFPYWFGGRERPRLRHRGKRDERSGGARAERALDTGAGRRIGRLARARLHHRRRGHHRHRLRIGARLASAPRQRAGSGEGRRTERPRWVAVQRALARRSRHRRSLPRARPAYRSRPDGAQLRRAATRQPRLRARARIDRAPNAARPAVWLGYGPAGLFHGGRVTSAGRARGASRWFHQFPAALRRAVGKRFQHRRASGGAARTRSPRETCAP